MLGGAEGNGGDAVRANLIDDVGVLDGWEISVSTRGGGSVGRWRRIGDRF